MALKGDRYELETTVDFFWTSGTTAERGGVATINTAGSGAALDQSAALVKYTAAQSGISAMGVLLNDVVNIDQTRQHINFHKNEVQTGGKVTLLKKGWIVTNQLDPGDLTGGGKIAKGDTAFVGPSGLISNKQTGPTGPSAAGVAVGQFDSIPDEDGYAKVSINIPQAHNTLIV
jgi:hypothetical protein